MKHLAQQAPHQLRAASEQLTQRFVLSVDEHAASYHGLCGLSTDNTWQPCYDSTCNSGCVQNVDNYYESSAILLGACSVHSSQSFFKSRIRCSSGASHAPSLLKIESASEIM